MNKLINLIQKLTPNDDKLAHFYWGHIYMLIGFLLTQITSVSNLFIIIPIFLGLLKELHDYRDYGGFSVLDWVYTSLPPFIQIIIYTLFI